MSFQQASGLFVPLKVDALVLSCPLALRGPTLDFQTFAKDGGPFVAGRGLAVPFSDAGFLAGRGVHLHWALPDFLTRGRGSGDPGARLTFPVAPDRWLILRDGQPVHVVESDFLDPAGPGIAYPDIDTDGLSGIADPVIARLGRRCPAGGWQEPSEGNRHLNRRPPPSAGDAHRLTALGWGDPLFAAFYPNCHSVFGWQDDCAPSAPLPNVAGTVRYDVIGWHSQAAQDFLCPDQPVLADALTAAGKRAPADDPPTRWRAALADLGLAVPDSQAPVSATFYVGSVEIAAGRDDARPTAAPAPLRIALGETGAEALVATLAQGEALPADVLTAAAFGTEIDPNHPDALFALQERLHSAAFSPQHGGTEWTVALADKTSAPDAAAPQLSPVQAAALAELNRLQDTLDRLTREWLSRQENCYSDWYLAQLALFPPEDALVSYPDAALAEALVQDIDLPLLAQCGARMQAACAARDAQLAALTTLLAATSPHRVPSRRPAARFWQPRDPVVLLEGAALAPGDRHDTGQPAAAVALPLVADWRSDAAQLARIRAMAQATARPDSHPLFLEWEAESQPPAKGNTLTGAAQLDPDFLTACWTLGDTAEAGADLVAGSAQGGFVARPDALLRGVSLLVPHAPAAMAQGIAAELMRRAAPASLPDRSVLQGLAGAMPIPAALAPLKAGVTDLAPTSALQRLWLAAGGWTLPGAPPPPRPADATDTVFAVLKAGIEALTDPQAPARQMQTLAGFNDALTGRVRGYQLPIACPDGTPASRALTGLVAQAVGAGQRPAPLPLADFQPLRSGRMRLNRLRLVDSFGRTRDIAGAGATQGADGLALTLPPRLAARPGSAPEAGWVGLTPRLLHPARLDLRFRTPEPQAGATVPAGPVAGWLLAVTLDGALQVSGPQGHALGRIAPAPDGQRVLWQRLPGPTAAPTPEAIADPALRRVVRWILAHDAAFLQEFLTGLGEAASRIDPAEARAHDALAMLYGRPFAVVRAELGLGLAGLPQGDVSWNGLRMRLRRLQSAGRVLRDRILPARGVWAGIAARLSPPGDAAALDAASAALSAHLTAARPALAETLPPALVAALDPALGALEQARGGAGLSHRVASLRPIGALLDQIAEALQEVFTTATFRAAGIGHLAVPVRLGEYDKLEDGLAGYWLEDADGQLGDTFFGCQMRDTDTAGLVSHAGGVQTIACRFADPPQGLTLLCDPTGTLHASCGLLPTAALRLRPEDYRPALEGMEIYLQQDACLTDPRAPRLPLPRVPGFAPQFLLTGRRSGAWQETAPVQPLSGAPGLEPGLQLLDGWLRLAPQPGGAAATEHAS